MNNREGHLNAMTWGHWYWPVALIVMAVTAASLFFPAEIYAITTNLNNTLSDYSRYELGLTTAFGQQTGSAIHTWAWWVSFVVWMGFVIWITGHIWFVQFG
jgi:hypothetical protein